jgi:Pvc16 N-terminal domain
VTNVLAIHSVGESLRAYLDSSYPADLRARNPCEFKLVSSGELAGDVELDAALTLYLYRVTVNEHTRNVRRVTGPTAENVPLAVDLHYLLTVWSRSAFTEQVVIAWAMRQLHQHPVLDASSLTPEAEWGSGDFVQVIPAELSTEDVMRIWDALDPGYRLSVSYIARVVRIDTDPFPTALPVVATRFAHDTTLVPA